MWLLDGAHRILAVRKLIAEDPVTLSYLKKLKMVIRTRKDGKDITPLEMVALGVHCNSVTGTNRATTEQDRIHAAVSTTELFLEDDSKKNSVNVPRLTVIMQGVLKFPSVTAQCRRYAIAGYRFATHPKHFQLFKQLGVIHRLGSSHVSCELLNDLDHLGLELALYCVAMFVTKRREENLRSGGGRKGKKGKGQIKGAFSDMEKSFYCYVKELYEKLVAAVGEYGITARDLFDTNIAILTGKEDTVKGAFITQMTLFRYAPGNSEVELEGHQRRLRFISSRISKALANDNPPQTMAARRTEVTASDAVGDELQRRSVRNTKGKKPALLAEEMGKLTVKR